MRTDRDIDRNRQMWEVLFKIPINTNPLTPEERKIRAKDSLNRIRTDIKISSSTINQFNQMFSPQK